MFVFILKQYPENFGFLILRNFELFAREVYTFLKKANFQHILLFLNGCKQTFHIYHIYHFAHISKSKRCFNVKSPTYYFHIKTNTMADFQICISVPLINQLTFRNYIFHVSRRSHPQVLLGRVVLKICSKFTREHPCRSAICVLL